MSVIPNTRLLALGVVLVALGALIAFGDSPQPVTGGSAAAWQSAIAHHGGMGAYETFARAVESSTPGQQHTEAHYFGAALFAAEGIPGLAVCDERFSYGCFHEFLGKAIAEHGLDIVSELNDRCIASLTKSPVSCQHGIGHGILAFLGYGESDFLSALEECRDLPYNDPIGGCYGGVFMEYNTQTMLGVDARLRVPAKGSEGAYEPCKQLPEEYAQACAFWQPQWWHAALFEGSAQEETFARMGSLCDGMTGGSAPLRRTCFEGIGNVVPFASQFDPALAARLCDAASADALFRLHCRSIAANSLTVGGAGMKGNGQAVCSGLSGEAYAYCSAYARNDANIVAELSAPMI